ncbi:MAG TPA: xylulokinase [Solirubrobacterales bacterium]|nr:xylulokinase [Solirubrobacterales bacterium]
MGVLVAGVDCSTQTTKVLVIDAEVGRVLARGSAPHEVSGVGGVRESDPEGWWEALQAALAQTGRAGEIEAIAVAAQQHALVLLDAAGRPLRPAPLWNDTTSAEDATGLVEGLGGPATCAGLVGSVPTSSFTVAKWARLRRLEPKALAEAGAVRLPHDFLTERLCGRAVSDRGDASGTGWWSPLIEAYAAEVLAHERVALDPALLPEVLTGSEAAGTASEAAVALGLSSEAVVAAGTGDNMAAAVGLGLAPGTPVLSLGTSGTVFAVTERASGDASGVVAGFADAGRRFLPLACTLNATLAVDRVAAWLGLEREDVEAAGEVAMLPYLDGERTPSLPRAAGTITGLRHDTRPQQILQAAYDGVVFGLLDALDVLGAQTGGVDPDAPLVLVGGGARGGAWRATVSRLSGRRLELPGETELAATGAAALAAAALSGGDTAAIACGWAAQRPATAIDAVARDDARLAQLRQVRAHLAALNEGD